MCSCSRSSAVNSKNTKCMNKYPGPRIQICPKEIVVHSSVKQAQRIRFVPSPWPWHTCPLIICICGSACHVRVHVPAHLQWPLPTFDSLCASNKRCPTPKNQARCFERFEHVCKLGVLEALVPQPIPVMWLMQHILISTRVQGPNWPNESTTRRTNSELDLTTNRTVNGRHEPKGLKTWYVLCWHSWNKQWHHNSDRMPPFWPKSSQSQRFCERVDISTDRRPPLTSKTKLQRWLWG